MNIFGKRGRDLRVSFERAFAEQMRSVALSAQKSDDVSSRARSALFRLEHQRALLARKSRLASLNVQVVPNLRRQHEAAILARRRDRRVNLRCLHFD